MLAPRIPVPWRASGGRRQHSAIRKKLAWQVERPDETVVDADPQPFARKSGGGGVSAFSGKQAVTGRARNTVWLQDGAEPLKPRQIAEPVVKTEIVAPITKAQLAPIVPRRKRAAEPMPPALLKWATERTVKPASEEKKTPRAAMLPVQTKTRADVEQLPPSLLAWATARGIKKTPLERAKPRDPFSTKSKVLSIDDRRQLARAALVRGDWCVVGDLDIFPAYIRDWLREQRCRLIKWRGGGSISGTPVNGYVTEDGTTFYVAEDGSTFYVQET